MTHRERILAAVNHLPVDRLPTDMWAVPEVQEKLMDHYGITERECDEAPLIGMLGGRLTYGVRSILRLWDEMDIDGILDIRPPYIGPDMTKDDELTYNEWGFGYRQSPYEQGMYREQVIHPLSEFATLDQIEKYPWPDPDWYDYSRIPDIIEQCQGRAVCCGYSAIFTYHNYLRGLELSLMDPMLSEEIAKYIIGRLSGFFYEYHRRCFLAGKGQIDFTQVTDDWGSQNSLITSPDIFRKFYKAPMKRAIDLAKEFDIKVFHHDDGDMRALLPDMAEMGIDLLNPIQWRCGDWDLDGMKDRYGSKICFHSGVDNQETLPLGTPEDVRSEVRMLKRTLGKDGTGYILGPCHNLQNNTAIDNILAMYDEAVK